MARYKNIEPIIDFIKKGLNNPDKSKAFGHDAIEILTELEYAPTADVVKVKHGYWKPTEDDGCWECSLCGGEIVIDAYGDIHPLDDCGWIGCPYCLAKMDGRRET